MGSRADNTIVVIPSYNESRTIGDIVSSINDMELSVLVIDDGSLDNTEKIALDNGAMVIRNRENKGKGACIRIGIEHVLKKTSFEWMIIMDADGQHCPGDIPALMSATHDMDADVVNGNRMSDTEDMPRLRYYTNRFTSWVLSKICGQDIPDTQCGYRLINTKALRSLKLTSDKYDIESEMLLQCAENDMTIRSVPVRTIYGEEVSEIKKIRDTINFFSLIISHVYKNHGLFGSKKKNG